MKSSPVRPRISVLCLLGLLSNASVRSQDVPDPDVVFREISRGFYLETPPDIPQAVTDYRNEFKSKEGGGRVVYGEDDRKDYHLLDEAGKAQADATCLVTWRAEVWDPARLLGLEKLPSGTLKLHAAELKGTPGSGTAVAVGLKGEIAMCEENPALKSAGGFGTAWLARPDIVVTAGHVLMKKEYLPYMAFVFGYRIPTEGGAAKSEFTAQEVYYGKEVVAFEYEGFRDYAVIRLDRPVTAANAKPLPLGPEVAVSKGTGVGMAGYPSGLPVKRAFGSMTRVFGEDNSKLCWLTNLDAFAGNSGSPVFDAACGKVIGILIAGDEIEYGLSNTGCFKVRTKPDAFKPTEHVLKLSVFQEKIP